MYRWLAPFAAVLSLSCAQAQSGSLTLEDLLAVRPIAETAVSPDGARIAFTREGQIFTIPLKGGWPVELTAEGGPKSALSWSPNGKTIAFASRGSIWTVPAAGGDPQRLTNAVPSVTGDPREAADRAPQWSPKGGGSCSPRAAAGT